MRSPRRIPPRMEASAKRGAVCCLTHSSFGLELILGDVEAIIKGSWTCEQLSDVLSVYTGGCPWLSPQRKHVMGEDRDSRFVSFAVTTLYMGKSCSHPEGKSMAAQWGSIQFKRVSRKTTLFFNLVPVSGYMVQMGEWSQQKISTL